MLPSYNHLIVEYAGMPDVPAYMQGVRHKEKVYEANRIPALFLYPQDLAGPEWPARVVERIERYGRADSGKRSTFGYHARRQPSGYR